MIGERLRCYRQRRSRLMLSMIDADLFATLPLLLRHAIAIFTPCWRCLLPPLLRLRHAFAMPLRHTLVIAMFTRCLRRCCRFLFADTAMLLTRVYAVSAPRYAYA